MSDAPAMEIYYDFACPYVYAATTWVHNVEEARGESLSMRWRAFPLEQVNSGEGPEWKLWEQPEGYRSRGLPAFLAASAARDQGDEAAWRFHRALIEAKHGAGKDHGKRETIEGAAREAGLDMGLFETASRDRSRLAGIGEDYEEGRGTMGVFGTPTFVFPNGQAAYLKLDPTAVPSGQEALDFFDRFVEVARDRPFVMEIKRPSR